MDRILLGVGVEIADHEWVGDVEAVEHARQCRCLEDTPVVEATLAVSQVGVGVGRDLGSAVLGLEVVDREREVLAPADPFERLDQRRSVEHGVGGGRRRSDWGDHRGLVDQRDLDRVGAERAAERVRRVQHWFGDGGVGAGRSRVVECRDQITDGRGTVVLDLHQAKDVGVETEDCGYFLGPLASELGGAVGAAGAVRAVVDGGEVVQAC